MNGTATPESSQYLSFRLDDEFFALEIAKVREVLEFTSVTKVPRTPDFLRGVINLRGTVVPVVDLRLKFGLSPTEKTINTCVVIVEVDVGGEQTILGALADSVEEVLELDSTQIDPPPRIGNRLDTSFVRGMGKRDDAFLILLDIDRLFTAQEVESVRAFGPAREESCRAA